MHIISRKALREFAQRHPNSKTALDNWFHLVRTNQFESFNRRVFLSADKVGKLIVFNIGGNKYRLIASIHFNRQKVYIRHILTHSEYDRGDVEKMTTITTQELAQIWGDLQAIVPVTVIHNEQQYERAVETLHTLLDIVGEDETHPLYEILDTLGTLVHTYEEEHYPAPTVNGIDVFKFLMEEHELNLSNFPEIGQEEEVAKLLSGQRELKVSEIRVLSNRFQISPASFI